MYGLAIMLSTSTQPDYQNIDKNSMCSNLFTVPFPYIVIYPWEFLMQGINKEVCMGIER